MATNPYSFYLDVISDWATSFSLENLFFCWFDFSSIPALSNDLNGYVSYWEGSNVQNGWNVDNSLVSYVLNHKNQGSLENLLGCVFAREVSLPGESLKAGNVGLNYGGYQAPVTSEYRNPYQKFTISFTETNVSFVDYVIRPWLILAGYHGFVSRMPTSDKNIKASSLDIGYLSKNGSGKRISQRKIARFYNVVPVAINSMKNSYQTDGIQAYNVDFVFDQYAIVAPTDLSASSVADTSNNQTPTQYSVPQFRTGTPNLTPNSTPTSSQTTGQASQIFSYLNNPAINFAGNVSTVTGTPQTYLSIQNNRNPLTIVPTPLK
jgi:hypothetical protein